MILWSLALAANIAAAESLPKIKTAPEFALTNQDGKRVALKDLRGKVLAITFIFSSCADTCPLLTAKMAGIQDQLGPAFGPEINFISITVDPERDTSAVLKDYLAPFDPRILGLTGTPEQVAQV
ncbi:MAG TPA: SCO family protein, partial [Candidatus Binatia bacterium]|nr:SCO family protein [Candidatus Binatia bacterium]